MRRGPAPQAGLWVFTAVAGGEATEVGRVAGCVFLAVVSVAAAVGFLVYGGRLFLMLRRFPVESRGRTKKLREARRRLTQCLPPPPPQHHMSSLLQTVSHLAADVLSYVR